MQNRYVGDIGDFGKYGLLRALTTPGPTPSLRLGVVWYLYPDESMNSDGKFIDYLCESPKNNNRFRVCDTELYDALRCLVTKGHRNIASVSCVGILPPDTLYYERPLAFPRHMKRLERQSLRESWIQSALQATEAADLVFLDPDNGIAGRELPWRKKGPKYVFMNDLSRFYTRGQSMVIYHHLGRHKPAVDQINHLSNELQSRLILIRPPISLRYHRGSARVYFIVCQDKHRSELQARIETVLQTPWENHFDISP